MEELQNGRRKGRRILNLATAAGFILLAAGSISSSWAQGTFVMPGEASSPVSAASEKVLAALDALNSLPAGEWKTHSGDVSHGELLNLDDSSWQSVSAPNRSSMGAVWYRKWIEIPEKLNGYDLTGSRIWFQFHAKANGPMPEIIYFDGRRVAMGDDLEPVVLFDKATPHEKVLVAVKLLATIDIKSFDGVSLKVDFPTNRPSPADLLSTFLTAKELIPVLSKNAAVDEATLEKAILSVELTALNAGDQARFDASLEKANEVLKNLKPTLQQASMFLTGNAHIDAAWLWPTTETVDVVKRTFGTALQLMDEYPDYTFTQSSAAYNEWIADKYPLMNEEIKSRIKEGRWEIVGGMWVEPDLNIPDGEALARSLLIGKRWFQKEYGVDVRIGWNPDSFGYSWQMPQIYKKSGIDYFVTQKLNWNDTNQLPFSLFWWASPDGSKVLTYLPRDYVHTDLNPARLAKDFAVIANRSHGLTQMMDLYGVGDHGGGPTRAILDEGLHWMQPDKIVPPMKFSTAQSYFNAVQSTIAEGSPEWNYRKIGKGYTPPPVLSNGQIEIPTWNSEMYFEYHRGIMTTQANHKRNMRTSEEETLNAEKYASFAWLQGQAYPAAELTEDWKKVTFNDFHDLAAGSGVGVIYKDSQKEFEQIRQSTEEISSKSLAFVAEDIDTQSNSREDNSAAVLVFNPLAWKRSETIEVNVELPGEAEAVETTGPHGLIASQVIKHKKGTNKFDLLIRPEDIPSLGYSVLHVAGVKEGLHKEQSRQALLKATGTTLENANLRITVDPVNGCITSLYDKRANFETIAHGSCGNQLQMFHDNPKLYDAWNIDPGTLDHPIAMGKADAVELTGNGPLRASIRVTHTWQKSKFVQEITLDAGADYVSVTNDIDWHETHILLKAAIPLAASSALATYEIPYGSIDRPTTRNNSWETAQFEVPALRWADLGDSQHGLSLINESKYGYDAIGNTLRLSLLRSPVWPDPDADRGHHHFRYALYPHAGSWKDALTMRRGYEFNYGLHAIQVLEHSGSQPQERSFITVAPENVVLTAVKKAEDADGLLLHLYEWAGKSANVEIHVPEGAKSAVVTNLMETPQGPPAKITGGSVTVPIKPYEILAVRVDYDKQSK